MNRRLGAGDLEVFTDEDVVRAAGGEHMDGVEPSLSCSTRLTVPEYLASPAALALSAAALVTIVPVAGRQFCGTWPDPDAWPGTADRPTFWVRGALLLELEVLIATPPIAAATAAARRPRFDYVRGVSRRSPLVITLAVSVACSAT
jgi:hypothetical protein